MYFSFINIFCLILVDIFFVCVLEILLLILFVPFAFCLLLLIFILLPLFLFVAFAFLLVCCFYIFFVFGRVKNISGNPGSFLGLDTMLQMKSPAVGVSIRLNGQGLTTHRDASRAYLLRDW